MRPFEIEKAIKNLAYKLDLLQSISNIFPVFYPWLFYLNKSDLLSRQIILFLPLIWFDKKVDLEEYIVKKILDSRIDKRRKDLVSGKKEYLMYKIKFTSLNKWNAKPDY